MNPRTTTLKQLVSQQRYPIDETAIAEAIIVRCMARHTVPGIVFHAAPPKPPIRSFRPHRGQSFRLARTDHAEPRRHMSFAVRLGSPAMR